MSVSIHPQAIVSPKAQLGERVQVGAFAMVGDQVKVGDDTVILHHATLEGNVSLGKENIVYPYSLIGGLTHDLKYAGGSPRLEIGDKNVFREYVTAHVATKPDDATIVGSQNVFLAYSHVAHDCKIKNNLVMSSHSALGGHVEVGNHVNVGWGAGVHQFCRLGNHCMVSACSKLVQDVAPYMLVDGSPAETRSINKIGMERYGYGSDEIELARNVFKVLFRQKLNRTQAYEQLMENKEFSSSEICKEILTFAKSSNRGIA